MIVAVGGVCKERIGVDIAGALEGALNVAVCPRADNVDNLSGAVAVKIHNGVCNRRHGILNAALEIPGDSAVRYRGNSPEQAVPAVCYDDAIAHLGALIICEPSGPARAHFNPGAAVRD